MRIFAAIALSSLAVERLSALRLRLATPSDGLRWTAPEQWHITLHFFGDLEDAQVELLVQTFRAIQVPEATVQLESLGRFPTKGILFAAVELSPSLLAMHQAFTSGLGASSSANVSSLPFHPHITLARSKGRAGHKTLEKLSSPALPPFGSAIRWQARQIALYESHLGPGGAEFRLLADIKASEAGAPAGQA